MAFTVLIPKIWKKASPAVRYVLIVAGIGFVGSAIVAGVVDAESHHWQPTRVVHSVQKIPGRTKVIVHVKRIPMPGPERVVTKLSPECQQYIEDVNTLYAMLGKLDGQWSNLGLKVSRFQVAIAARNPGELAQAQHEVLVQENRTTSASVNADEMFQTLKLEKESCK